MEPKMNHMHLHKDPFERILSGSQKIEARINDEKRRLLNVGDNIEFTSREDPERKFRAEIIELLMHDNFENLYSSFPVQQFGGTDLNHLLTSIYKYYSKEEETKWGVVGIRLEVLE
jgi:ASC-1-like (ASCH) protein